GFFTCLEADGKVYDDRKFCWLLSRQVWTYARLYQERPRFRLPHILEAAKKGADFVMKHVKDPSTNKCYLNLTREGKPLKSQRTIFSESFYVMAMAEMYRVTKEDVYKKEAMTMMKQIVKWVKVDSSGLGPRVQPPTPTSSLAVPMIFLMLIDQLGVMDPAHQAGYNDLADWCLEDVLKHVQRGGLVLENVSEDGQELPGSAGRLINPGHAIETGWVLLERAVKHGNEDLKQVALETFITESFNRGWDDEFGGLFYFMDADGRPPLQLEWDMKLWWPHNESMVAFLMAYKYTGEEKYLQQFAKVFDYAYGHFVDFKNGEW
ncbi:unnamed protein product, partial [Lymnaea stagnalis]